MAGAAVLGRLTWQVATARAVRPAAPGVRTIELEVPGWPGHLAGQHVDVRLTAPDGYTATRAYSIADAADGERVAITVAEVPDGEVSVYLTRELRPGDQVEVRGPLGGWFVWRPADPAPVQLLGAGTGIVPLVAMVRTRSRAGSRATMQLLCSVREPRLALYADELAAENARPGGTRVTWQHTRVAPAGERAARIGTELLRAVTLPPAMLPTCYVCGPTGFVESMAELLVELGHDGDRIRTERFGPTGGRA